MPGYNLNRNLLIYRSYAVPDPKAHCASSRVLPDILNLEKKWLAEPLFFQKDTRSTMLPQASQASIRANVQFAWQLHDACK
jgi:hypothetical protein